MIMCTYTLGESNTCCSTGGLCYVAFISLLQCVLFCYRIDAERLPITTTLAADAALTAAVALAAAAQTHRCLFVLTPPASCNFNKSLSKTSTFALGLQRVSRRFRAVAPRPFSRRLTSVVLLLLLLLLRRDEVVLISAILALQLTGVAATAPRCPSKNERTSDRDDVPSSRSSTAHCRIHDARL